MTKCDNHVECFQIPRHFGCEWCGKCGFYVIEKPSTSTIPTAELEALRAKAEADSAELAKAEADKRCDEALAKLSEIKEVVDVLHEEDCHFFAECTCIYGRIRAILQGAPEGQNA